MRGSAASGEKLFKVSYVVFLESGEDGRQSGFFLCGEMRLCSG